MEHKRYSRAAAERRRLWFERHQRLPTRVLGPDDEFLFALVHRLARPTLPTPIPSHRVTADLAWRVAFDRAAVMVTVRGQLVASIQPLVVARECEGLAPDDLLCCDTKDFRRRRNAVLTAMAQGQQQQRIVLQYHDLLLAHLGPVPPQLTRKPVARRCPQPGPMTNELRLSEEPDDAQEQPGEPAVGLEETAANRSPAVPGMPVTEVPTPTLTSEQAGRAEDHTGLVRRLAQRASHLVGTKALSCSEFRSVGNEALVEAARRYDPERRASFNTFAGYRVFGAMMDAVRKHSRSGRHEPLTHRDQASGPSPEQALIAADECRRLSLLVSALELHEQALVEALYVDERTMTDIASETGVHTSTVSRRHARILDRLGKRMVAQERGSVSPDVVRSISRRDS